MEGALPIIFLAVVLKIPVFFAIWLVWWAVKDEPTLEDASGEAGDHASAVGGARRPGHGGRAAIHMVAPPAPCRTAHLVAASASGGPAAPVTASASRREPEAG